MIVVLGLSLSAMHQNQEETMGLKEKDGSGNRPYDLSERNC